MCRCEELSHVAATTRKIPIHIIPLHLSQLMQREINDISTGDKWIPYTRSRVRRPTIVLQHPSLASGCDALPLCYNTPNSFHGATPYHCATTPHTRSRVRRSTIVLQHPTLAPGYDALPLCYNTPHSLQGATLYNCATTPHTRFIVLQSPTCYKALRATKPYVLQSPTCYKALRATKPYVLQCVHVTLKNKPAAHTK